MKFKKRINKLYPLLLAIGLIFSMVFSPVCTVTGFAADVPQIEETDNNGNNPETPEIVPEGEDSQSSDLIPPSENMVPDIQIPMVESPEESVAEQPSNSAEPQKRRPRHNKPIH